MHVTLAALCNNVVGRSLVPLLYGRTLRFMRLRIFSMHPMLATVLALALGALLLIAGCAGSTKNSTDESADTTMAASAPRADFSGLVKIGGSRKIYMTCQGTGSPTVVLVSGRPD